jgi:hypothetical protein
MWGMYVCSQYVQVKHSGRHKNAKTFFKYTSEIKSFQMGECATFWSLYNKQDLHRISAKCMTVTIHTNPAQPQEYWISDVLLCTLSSWSPTLVISIAPSTFFQEMLYCFSGNLWENMHRCFLRIKVALLEHLSISSNHTIFYITINSTVIYG